MRHTFLFAAAAAAVISFAWRQEPQASPELLTDEYRQYAELEIIRRFHAATHREPTPEELAEARWLVEQRTLDLPKLLARELSEREMRNIEARAELEGGGPLAMLANLAGGGGGPMPEYTQSREAFAALLPRTQSSTRADIASSEQVAAALKPGVTLAFAPGVFELPNLLAAPDGFPAEVALEGAGREATLLVLTDAFESEAPLEDFRIAHCTLLTHGNALFSQRAAATVELDDVRVIGFDNGIGEGALLDFRGGAALLARDCEFLGGFGSRPAGGLALATPQTAFIARFDSCKFDLQSIGLGRMQRGVTLRFVDCTLSRILDNPKRDTEHWLGVEFEGGSFQRIPVSAVPREPRTVDELFKGWREKR